MSATGEPFLTQPAPRVNRSGKLAALLLVLGAAVCYVAKPDCVTGFALATAPAARSPSAAMATIGDKVACPWTRTMLCLKRC